MNQKGSITLSLFSVSLSLNFYTEESFRGPTSQFIEFCSGYEVTNSMVHNSSERDQNSTVLLKYLAKFLIRR